MPRLQMLSWGKGVRCLNLHGELQHNTSATKATPSRSHHTNWWWLQPILGFTEKRRSRSHEAIYGEEPVRPGDHARRLWNYWDLELRQVEMVGHDWHMRMMNRKANQIHQPPRVCSKQFLTTRILTHRWLQQIKSSSQLSFPARNRLLQKKIGDDEEQYLMVPSTGVTL